MIAIDSLVDLIYKIPDLINLFLPGFIFMCVYIKLFDKNIDISLIVIWSLFISDLFKIYYSTIHTVFLSTIIFQESVKNLIYIITGVILPIIIKILYNSNLYKKILLKSVNRTINKNIFDDVIDFDKKTMVKVYIKDLDVFYLGTFSLIEENGKDSYISLIDYALLKKDTCAVVYKEILSSAVINLSDIERLEFIYENDSNTWKRLYHKN